MTRPLLPPRGIFTGTRWLYDPELSPNVKETLLQLMALTWGSEAHTTPPLSYAQLEALTGKNARTLRGHLSALRSYQAALRLLPAGSGQFIILLAPWLYSNIIQQAEETASGKTLPSGKVLGSDKTFPSGKVLSSDKTFPPPDHHQNQEEEASEFVEREFLDLLNDQAPAPENASQAQNGRPGSLKHAPAAARKLSKKLQTRLSEAGVFPVLLEEIATRAAEGRYSETELGALLDWCADDQPDRPAALFIGRLRAGARAPSLYRTPPCPRCGQRGKHAQECPERYGPMDY